MKEQLFQLRWIFLLSMSIAFLVSCEQTNFTSFEELKPSSFEPVNESIIELIRNIDDTEDEFVNLTMLEAATWLNKTIQNNNEFKIRLIEELIKSNRNTVVLDDFIEKETDYSTSKAFLRLNKKEGDLKYKGVKYHLEIYSPNSDTFLEPINTEPFICIGEAINEKDQIVGLRGNEKYYISESHSKNFPVLIVTIGTNEIVKANKVKVNWNHNTNQSKSMASTKDMTAVWDDYQIKNGYRYEKSGKSDVRFHFTPYANWNCIGYPSYNSSLDPNFRRKAAFRIKNVKKKDIENSILFDKDIKIVSLPIAPANRSEDHFFYITVYEYDWYATPKTVQGCTTGPNCTNYIEHYVQMKYNNEWYYIDFCGFGFKNSNVGDSFTVNNAKCRLTIKRTE